MTTNSLTSHSLPEQSASTRPRFGWLSRLKRVTRAKWVGMALMAASVGLLGSGCAVEPGGYGSAFYEPDYAPYYSDYGYNGLPFDGGYYGGDIFIGGVHHHGYYGGHHMGHDFHGGGHWGGGHGGGGHWGGGHGGGGHGGGGHR